MTSHIWPNDYEWELWFSGKKEKALWVYRATEYHWHEDRKAPSLEQAKEVFQDCINTKIRGLKPYERFLRSKTNKTLDFFLNHKFL